MDQECCGSFLCHEPATVHHQPHTQPGTRILSYRESLLADKLKRAVVFSCSGGVCRLPRERHVCNNSVNQSLFFPHWSYYILTSPSLPPSLPPYLPPSLPPSLPPQVLNLWYRDYSHLRLVRPSVLLSHSGVIELPSFQRTVMREIESVQNQLLKR